MQEEFRREAADGPEILQDSELPEAAFKILGEMTPAEVQEFHRSYKRNRGSDESWRLGYATEAVQRLRKEKR